MKNEKKELFELEYFLEDIADEEIGVPLNLAAKTYINLEEEMDKREKLTSFWLIGGTVGVSVLISLLFLFSATYMLINNILEWTHVLVAVTFMQLIVMGVLLGFKDEMFKMIIKVNE